VIELIDIAYVRSGAQDIDLPLLPVRGPNEASARSLLKK
jgi:hypothetical protein